MRRERGEGERREVRWRKKDPVGRMQTGWTTPRLENLTIVQLKHHPEPLKSLKRKSLFDWYSSSSSVAVIKHCVKKQPGEGKSSLAHNPRFHSATSGKSRQEFKQPVTSHPQSQSKRILDGLAVLSWLPSFFYSPEPSVWNEAAHIQGGSPHLN